VTEEGTEHELGYLKPLSSADVSISIVAPHPPLVAFEMTA